MRVTASIGYPADRDLRMQRRGSKPRHDRWVTSWSEAVRGAGSAVGLFELPSTRFVAASEATARLLDITLDDVVGLDVLEIQERPDDVATMFRLLTEGAYDGAQANRQVRLGEGSVVRLRSCMRAIRSPDGSDLVLWVGSDMVTGDDTPIVTEELDRLLPRLLSSDVIGGRTAVGTLDADWRVALISADVEQILGYAPADVVGSSLIVRTHPDDDGALLLAHARATSEGNARVRVRLRHSDGSWRPVVAIVTFLDARAPSRFAFAFAAPGDVDADSPSGRLAQIEESLRRIAGELGAVGVLSATGAAIDVAADPRWRELSPRQRDIVDRLARGERVPTIADEMYLSQSTVRNHLGAVFAKFGVHSQAELLGALRHPDR